MEVLLRLFASPLSVKDRPETKPRRHARLVRTLLQRLEGRLSEIEIAQAAADMAKATEKELETWTYRALFHPRWSSIVSSNSTLSGIELIRFDFLIFSAIQHPLEMWCLRILYPNPKRDDEWDTNLVLSEAPWLRDCFGMVDGLVEELQVHRSALLCCQSEDLARGLFLASQPPACGRRRRRMAVQLYSSKGHCVACG
jgi:hypothetical protein